jgi:dynein heavy chain, axonemal
VQRGYGVNEFHEDLKSVLMSAGAENLPTVFLFSDTQVRPSAPLCSRLCPTAFTDPAHTRSLTHAYAVLPIQIVTESFLEDINNILNSGEVPNLYAADEMEKIVNMVRPLAKGEEDGNHGSAWHH